MAKEKNDIVNTTTSSDDKSSMKKPKLLIIGLPVFVVQLILVYFITANVLIKNNQSSNDQNMVEKTSTEEEQASDSTSEEHSNESSGNFIYNIDDVIVNPANTNGKMLLLTSIGLDCEKEDTKKNLENKQIVVKDIIISVLSSKTVDQLSQMTYRDSVKSEITDRLKSKIPEAKIKNVYFSKFIIQ